MLSYKAVYSVSDLHIGPDDRAPKSAEQWKHLGDLFTDLAEREPKPALLALNGDVFDFLRFDDAQVVTWRAPDRIAELAGAIAKPVFEGLRNFARVKGNSLLFVAGNHDIELAIGDVQTKLRELIAEGNDEAEICFVDGVSGFEVLVGGRRVQLVHGNAVDPWNVVDFTYLRRLVAGKESKVTANAGTALVLEVLKPRIAKYPFIEFLKPESFPLLRLVAAISEPSALARDLATLMPLIGRQGWARWVSPAGMLASDPRPFAARSLEDLMEELGNYGRSGKSVDELYEVAARSAAESLDPVSFLEADGELGRWRALTTPSLREALAEWLDGDRTFELGHRDETCDRLLVEHPHAEILIAGHTHLERLVPVRRDGSLQRVYLNTGTWMRLIRLHPVRDLGTDDDFERTRTRLLQRPITSLDESGLVRHPRPYASVVEVEDRVEVRLDYWKEGDRKPQSEQLEVRR